MVWTWNAGNQLQPVGTGHQSAGSPAVMTTRLYYLAEEKIPRTFWRQRSKEPASSDRLGFASHWGGLLEIISGGGQVLLKSQTGPPPARGFTTFAADFHWRGKLHRVVDIARKSQTAD